MLTAATAAHGRTPGLAPAAAKWFTTYYATWSMNPLGSSDLALPPWEIDFSGLTHVILFDNGNVTKTPPYWAYMFGPPPLRPDDTESDSVAVEFNGVASPGDGTWPHYLDSLVSIAHRRGVKVLVTIQAVNPLNLNYVAEDSARSQVLIDAVAAWAERKHFDGVELDWEGWAAPLPSARIVNRFVRMLYARVHRMRTVSGEPGMITISAGSGQQSLYDPAQDAMVDQFNLQLYDYSYAWYGKIDANAAWYLAPLHRGVVDSSFEGQAYDTRGPLQWIAAGHDPARLGMGVPIFGNILRNVDGLFQKMDWDGDYGLANYQVIEELKSIGGVEEWDDVRKVRSIRGTAQRSNGRAVYYRSDGVEAGQKFFATGETPRSLVEKINWMIENGLGGIMTYDLVSDFDPAQPLASGRRHPLQRVVANALGLVPPGDTQTGHFSYTADTGVKAAIVIPGPRTVTVDSTVLQPGDEIGVFGPSGRCVGAGAWNGAYLGVIVWGDNLFTPELDGMRAGDTLAYRVWQKQSGREFSSVKVLYQTGSGIFRPNGIDVIASLRAVSKPTGGIQDDDRVPKDYWLGQNYPNPFNPETRIRFAVPVRSRVKVAVYDLLGRTQAVLADGEFAPGWHTVVWRASKAASGIYICRLTSGAATAARVMTLLK